MSSMTSEMMVVVNRLVKVRPINRMGRGMGVSQFDSSTPVSMSFFSA